MKYSAFIILLFLTACKDHEAQKFCDDLEAAEQRVYQIMVSDGAEKKRLQALVDGQPQLAKEITLGQINGLDRIIGEIQRYDVDDIDSARAVKKSTLSYYRAYRGYKLLDTVDAYLLRQSLHNINNVQQTTAFRRSKIAETARVEKLDLTRNRLIEKFKLLHRIK